MSGIAKVAHDRGIRVTGSDLKESRYTRTLLEAGVEVHIGHEADQSRATRRSSSSHRPFLRRNPELAAARERGLDIWPRAKMLAHLAGDRQTVAVAGTHGKTTTSAMIATMLAEMGEDPTFLVGGEVAAFGTNAGCGEGPHYVVEADESDGSFMFLDPRRRPCHQHRSRPSRSLRLRCSHGGDLLGIHGQGARGRGARGVRRRSCSCSPTSEAGMHVC